MEMGQIEGILAYLDMVAIVSGLIGMRVVGLKKNKIGKMEL